MFTGLVQDVGTVASISRGGMTRIAVATAMPAEEFALGESIALDGICLTVLSRSHGRFEVEASPETLRRTTLGSWAVGTRVNLERALRLADRLGGHLVLGHVDAVAKIQGKRPEGGALVMEFELPEALAPFFIEKGSVAIDGTSLTVNTIERGRFTVSLIPETQARTTLAARLPGTSVNLEADVIGKYVARLLGKAAPGTAGGVDLELLRRSGFA
jgi:riboflavin synthase